MCRVGNINVHISELYRRNCASRATVRYAPNFLDGHDIGSRSHMTFLNPLLLVVLAAAAIPLIIHLFNFRKPARINFSSLAFLNELQKSTMRRVRIKQWLLLALRTLAIAALVMSFARPAIQGSLAGFGSHGRSSTALVFDNSSSMLLRDGNGSYIEQARNIGLGLAEAVESGDELFFVPAVSAALNSAAHLTSASARAAVMNINVAGGEMRLTDAIRKAAAMLENSANPNREIHILSDLQKSTFSDSLDAKIDDDIRVFLIPIGGQEHDNIAITDVQVLSRILSPGQVVRLQVRVENLGKRAVSDLVLSLFLEDQRVAQATVDLGAGESALVPIAVTPRSSGWVEGRIEIQDADYEEDDTRALTLFIPEERRLLLVTGTGAESSFLNLAFSSEMTGDRVQFDVTSINETALASLALAQFDTIVLNGMSDLSSGERSMLSQYVMDGGGILMFPGDETVISDYTLLFESLGGGSASAIEGSGNPAVSVAVFDRVDHEHALFEGMFDTSSTEDSPQLEQPDIFRMMMYHPGQGDEQTIVRMSGDRVFMQEIRAGRGSLILITVAPELEWTDFPVRGLFVPLLFRSVYYLSSAGSVSGENFQEGLPAQLRLAGLGEDASVRVVSEDGTVYLPDLRRVPGGLLASIEQGYLVSGIYDVTLDNTIIQKFSVHPDRRESSLETYSAAEAVLSLSESVGGQIAVVNLTDAAGDELRSRLRAARTGTELWNVFLVLALVFLIAEMIIEKSWRPESA
ncbi:MAG: hypothetical protein E2O84_03680 [Bacteroidetes bacterium]|nr:MAG: hypothetical protein E2O84_03680 [Bacteroidota bacterium]